MDAVVEGQQGPQLSAYEMKRLRFIVLGGDPAKFENWLNAYQRQDHSVVQMWGAAFDRIPRSYLREDARRKIDEFVEDLLRQ